MENSHSIKIQYDAVSKTVRFFIEDDAKLIATLDLSKNRWSEIELEQHVGYVVIASLSAAAGDSIGGRNYREERNSAIPLVLERFGERLTGGDESAVITMVHELVASAIRNSDLGEMVRAEQLLQESAGAGNSHAIEYLKNEWPQTKLDISDSIQRRQRDGGV